MTETPYVNIDIRVHIWTWGCYRSENREDDYIETIQTRIKYYDLETKPVTEYYHKNYNSIYYEIEGASKVDEIQKKLIKIVKNTNFT